MKFRKNLLRSVAICLKIFRSKSIIETTINKLRRRIDVCPDLMADPADRGDPTAVIGGTDRRPRRTEDLAFVAVCPFWA